MKKTTLLSIALLGLFSSPVWADPSCPLPRDLGRIDNPQGKKLYTVRYNSDIYTYWNVAYQREGQTFNFETVLRQDSKGRCYVADADPSGEGGSMTKGVPRKVAKTFSLRIVQDAIKTKGRESIQANINKTGRDYLMGQETVDALTSLNFKVPSSIRVDPYWDGSLTQRKYR
jgi:hypothetical protein